MKRTRSSKKRSRRRSRKYRGGGPQIDPATIQWPSDFGCDIGSKRIITLQPGTYIDRFGPPSGFFVSPVIKQPYSYSERSLPWLGITNTKKTLTNGRERSIRKEYYYMDYENPLIKIDEDQYHIYKVQEAIDGVEACTAAPYFDYPGGAVQYKLPRAVKEYIDEGKLKEDVFFPIIPPFV